MDLITGSGYDQADLMVVADYARKADETSRICLSGYYERKLSEYLNDADFPIHKTYRTCVVKLYEKGLGVGTWGMDRKLLAAQRESFGLVEDYWLNILIDEINSIQPAVIIAMGEYALRVLTLKESIGNYRGSVLPFRKDKFIKLTQRNPPKVVACQHLSIEHTQEEQKFLLRMDIQKAVDLVYEPLKPIDDHEVFIARDINDYLRFRNRYDAAPARMTTDLESHHGFITCASFTFDGYRGLCIPLTGSKVVPLERARMSVLLGRDLANTEIAKGNQNIGYDRRIYQRFGFTVNNIKWDTHLAASVIAAEFPKRLGFLTSIYCDGIYHKDEGKEFDPSKHSYDQLYTYCAKDSIKTYQIETKQKRDLAELGALEFFEDLMMRWFHMYYDIDSVGILASTTKQRELLGKYEGLYNLKLIELTAITGTPLRNLAYQAVGEYMEENNFPVLRHRTNSGKIIPNTDAESFKKMRSAAPQEYKKCKLTYEHAIRFINLILLLRRIDKIIEYVETGIHPDGRIRTNVNLGGTASGRTSNGKTSDAGYYWDRDNHKREILNNDYLGRSLQTVTKHGFIIEGEDDEEIEDGIIGKDVREMYIPDSGFLLIEIDRSQAEARVVDLLAEDYEGLEEYAKIDKHSKNASIIFPEFTYETIRSRYKAGADDGAYMRQIGKKAVHATNFDMGDFRLSMLANIPKAFAAQCLRRVHAAKPQIKNIFHASVEAEVRRTRRLDNPIGRPRIFFKKLDGHGIKVAYSWYPQSTISDTTKLAMLKLYDAIDRTKAFLVAENHDSITALVRYGYAHTYVALAKQFLTEPIDFRRGTFNRDYELIIPVEVAISRKSWGEMKELKKLHLVTQ